MTRIKLIFTGPNGGHFSKVGPNFFDIASVSSHLMRGGDMTILDEVMNR